MSCAVTTAAAHGIRAKPGRAPGNTAPRGGPYPEQGIQTWFVQGHVALGVARQAHRQHLQSENAHQNIHKHKNTQQRNAACAISKHLPKDRKTPAQSTSKQQDNSRPSTPKTPRR